MTLLTQPEALAEPRQLDRPEIHALGTTVAIFAHPDDEAYIAGGLLAALRDAGQRVVCVTATRGDAGNGLHDNGAGEARRALAAVRTAELARSLEVFGVAEHHWLGYSDTGCADVNVEEAVGRLWRILTQVQPRTVVSFGLDGFTGHADHRTVAHWAELAVRRSRPRPRLLQAVTTETTLELSRDVNDSFDVFVWGYPPVVAEQDLAVRLVLDGDELSRKVAALQQQPSQTAALISAIGVDRFAQWVSAESFREG